MTLESSANFNHLIINALFEILKIHLTKCLYSIPHNDVFHEVDSHKIHPENVVHSS